MRKFKCIENSEFEGRFVKRGETIETDVDLSGHVGFAEIKPVPVTPSAPANPPPAPPASPDAPPSAPPSNPPPADTEGKKDEPGDGDSNPPPAPPASPDAPPPAPPSPPSTDGSGSNPPAPPAPPSAPEGNNGRKGGRKASQK